MKNKKITKRDIKVFLLGLLTAFIFSTILNWSSVKKDFKAGWDASRNKTENIKQ